MNSIEECKGFFYCDHQEQDECKQNMRNLSGELAACRRAFVALGDETRLHIIAALLESDPAGIRVGAITTKTNLSRPAVSHHIKVLMDAGIIRVRREGTRNYYYLDYEVSELNKIEALFAHIRKLISTVPDRSGDG